MRQLFFTITALFLLTSCNQGNSTNTSKHFRDGLSSMKLPHKSKDHKRNEIKRVAFRRVSEIVTDSSCSAWVELQDSSASLALHFDHSLYKDTLAVSYSPECWLMFPYKLDSNRIVVYWDDNIDTKYNFDIVKAIKKIDKKYIGKPFMILELVNDTTLRVTYPLKYLIKKINSASEERTFFPDKFVIAQEGFL